MRPPKLKAHPAADLFPMLPPAELERLADDIEKNGQHDPIIITSDHLVLDGRNRLAACELRGIEPDVQMWDREDDNISPAAWVIGKNVHRRHLTPTQVAMVAARAIDLFRAEAKERQRRGTAPGQEGGTAAAAAAQATGAAERSVARALAVLKVAPASLVASLDSGAKTLKQAERDLKRREHLDQVKVYRPPAGEYGLIVVDYSWKYDDTREGSDRVRNGAHYPRMTIAQICAFPIPSAPDCLLGCWITNTMLIGGAWEQVRLSLLERYGFEPFQMRTWIKTTSDASTPNTGLGGAFRNNTEHLILLKRGRVAFAETGSMHAVSILHTAFTAPVGKGSEKPALAFDQLAAICPMQPRLEMFARAERPGWVTTGSELPKKQRRRA